MKTCIPAVAFTIATALEGHCRIRAELATGSGGCRAFGSRLALADAPAAVGRQRSWIHLTFIARWAFDDGATKVVLWRYTASSGRTFRAQIVTGAFATNSVHAEARRAIRRCVAGIAEPETVGGLGRIAPRIVAFILLRPARTLDVGDFSARLARIHRAARFEERHDQARRNPPDGIRALPA